MSIYKWAFTLLFVFWSFIFQNVSALPQDKQTSSQDEVSSTAKKIQPQDKVSSNAQPKNEATKSELSIFDLPQNIELPLKVNIIINIKDIIEIREIDGVAKVDVEIIQEWVDPSASFDPVKQGAWRIDHVATLAEQYLNTIWTPHLSADNRISNIESRTLAVSNYSNGKIVLIERYKSNFQIDIDMRAFPFDRQHLVLKFSLPNYSKQDVVLVSNEASRKLSQVNSHLSIVDWIPLSLKVINKEIIGWNANKYSSMHSLVTLERRSSRFALQTFSPVFTMLMVSILVLYSTILDAKTKATLIFSSLLGLSALSFTFESTFPGSFSLNTPISKIIAIGYLYLIVILLFKSFLGNQSTSKLYQITASYINWGLPTIMLIICIGLVIRTIPLDM